MMTLAEHRVAHVRGLSRCPICSSNKWETDPPLPPASQERAFRSSDDLVAVRFGCGGEISVEERTGEIVGRIPCPMSYSATLRDMNEETAEDHEDEVSR